LFTIAICFATGIVFGIFPALHVARANVGATLKENSARGTTGTGHNFTRSALMVAELTLALVLLSGAALLIRTFVGLRATNPGLDPHNVITMQTSLGAEKYSKTAQVALLTQQALERIESLPGVEAAATALVPPASGEEIDLPFTIAGKAPAKGQTYEGDEQWRFISAHYFSVFKIPVVRGRAFNDRDVQNSTPVVIINEAFAKKHFPNQDPLGKVLIIGKGLGPEFEDPPRQIIGIVKNARETSLTDDNDPGAMYVPASQLSDLLTQLANRVVPLTWAVRATRDPRTITAAVERELQSADPRLGIANVKTMDELIAGSIARQNFNMLLLTIFAGVALLLATVGIYGLMSYTVQQRTSEIGLRVALGARAADTLRLVMLQGAKLAAAGVVLGLLAAWALTRLLASLLVGVHATDPVTFVTVALILSAVTLIASYVPARRATRIDPVIALRWE
jgi:predicted permease